MSVWEDELLHNRMNLFQGNGCDSDVESNSSAWNRRPALGRSRVRYRPSKAISGNFDVQRKLSMIHDSEGIEGILKVLSAKALMEIGRASHAPRRERGLFDSESGHFWVILAIAATVLAFDGWGSKGNRGMKGFGG